jgi:hypothetical protein
MIAFCYITLDLYYAFWGGMLKYHFPPRYLAPISSVFYGAVDKALIRFKLRKPKTDIEAEAKAQKDGLSSNNQKNDNNINNNNGDNNDFVVNMD